MNEAINVLTWVILPLVVAFAGMVMWVEWQEARHQKKLIERAIKNKTFKP